MPHVARVKDGRLVLDEPTDLPEGTTLELYEADDRPEDQLEEEELRRLDEEVRRSLEDIQAGRGVSAEVFFQSLRPSR